MSLMEDLTPLKKSFHCKCQTELDESNICNRKKCEGKRKQEEFHTGKVRTSSKLRAFVCAEKPAFVQDRQQGTFNQPSPSAWSHTHTHTHPPTHTPTSNQQTAHTRVARHTCICDGWHSWVFLRYTRGGQCHCHALMGAKRDKRADLFTPHAYSQPLRGNAQP